MTRNGNFQTERLSTEDLEDLGGVEYRALRVLAYVVGLVSTHLALFLCQSDYPIVLRSGSVDTVHRYSFLAFSFGNIRFGVPGADSDGAKGLVGEPAKLVD